MPRPRNRGCVCREEQCPSAWPPGALSADVQPSRQDAVNHRKQQPTEPGFQTLYYLVRDWLDLPAAYGREGETYCSATVADSYPALDQIAAERVTDVIGVDCLLVQRCKIIGHAMKVSVRDQRAAVPNPEVPELYGALRARSGAVFRHDRLSLGTAASRPRVLAGPLFPGKIRVAGPGAAIDL